MRSVRHAMLLALALPAGAAQAQVPPAELGARYVPAPWWMRDPVIAASGSVEAELPANRARFQAEFGAVERDAPAAIAAAARSAAALDATLRGFGAERARLTTTFRTRPLYEQYRDKDGNLVDNQRADKIDRYEAVAVIDVEVRDIAVLEKAYRAVVAARPTRIGTVDFSLVPDNRLRAELATQAIRDAAWRARDAADAAGARLGPAKIIDPSGRVCQTDVLAGWPSYVGGTRPTDVTADIQAMAVPPPPAPPPPPPPAPAPGAATVVTPVTLQPPLQTLSDQACVIFGLLP